MPIDQFMLHNQSQIIAMLLCLTYVVYVISIFSFLFCSFVFSWFFILFYFIFINLFFFSVFSTYDNFSKTRIAIKCKLVKSTQTYSYSNVHCMLLNSL